MGEEAEGGGAGSLGKTGASGQTVCESSGREPASGLSGNYSIEGSVKKDEINDIWNVDIEENILCSPKMTGNT